MSAGGLPGDPCAGDAVLKMCRNYASGPGRCCRWRIVGCRESLHKQGGVLIQAIRGREHAKQRRTAKTKVRGSFQQRIVRSFGRRLSGLIKKCDQSDTRRREQDLPAPSRSSRPSTRTARQKDNVACRRAPQPWVTHAPTSSPTHALAPRPVPTTRLRAPMQRHFPDPPPLPPSRSCHCRNATAIPLPGALVVAQPGPTRR